MKKIVYTVLLGDYKLNEPTFKNFDWQYICFTDQNIKSKNWKIIKIKGGKKKSRELKIKSNQYFDYDLCIYLDAKFTVKILLDDFVSKYLKTDFSLMKHNKRICTYDEGHFCIKINKDKKEIILPQLQKYRNEGFPKDFGLYAPGVMIKKNTNEVNHFMKLWYDEVDKHSYRDIISFSYVLWKYPINFNTMPFKEIYTQFR